MSATRDFTFVLLKILVLIILAALNTPVVFASEPPELHVDHGRKMIVIIADRIGLSDWRDGSLNNLRKAEEIGALGLMVTRTEANGSRTAAYITLGAGVSSPSRDQAGLAFGADELYENRPASLVYEIRTGTKPPEGSLILLGIGAFQQQWRKKTLWEGRAGALGTLLRSAGLRTSAIGNQDIGEAYSRLGPIVAMDEMGIVDGGDISPALIEVDMLSPLGLRMNMDQTIAALRKSLAKDNFIVIVFPDTAFAESITSVSTEIGYTASMSRAMKRLNMLVGKVFSIVDLEKTQVIIISPTPKYQAIRDKQTLTPILVFGAGIKQRPSLLTSDSTKRAGIVVITDFTAHVCEFFGIPPAPDFVGKPFRTAAAGNPVEKIVRLQERDSFVENQFFLMRILVYWQIAMMILCFVTMFRMAQSSKPWLTILSALIPFTAGMPLALLLAAAFPGLTTNITFYPAYIGICLVTAFAAALAPGVLHKMILFSSLYFVSITADQLAGGPLIRNSILGYYPQLGARFYGIGNEFMGFMISAPIVLTGLSLDLKPEWSRSVKAAGVFLMAMSILIVGSPTLGANFGGLISCAIGCLVMSLLMFNGGISWKTLALVTGGVLILLVIYVLVDSIVLGGATHVGRLGQRMLQGGGFSEFAKIVARKLSVNLRLLRVSFWSLLFIINILIAFSTFYFPVERVKKLFRKYPGFHKAYLASVCGALAAFFFNDSGVVPGGISTILPTASLFLMLFNRFPKKRET